MLRWLEGIRPPPDAAAVPCVLVLRASGVIGQAIAAQGAALALHAHRNAQVQGELIEQCAKLGATKLCGVQGDLAAATLGQKIVNEAASALGDLDVMVIAVGQAGSTAVNDGTWCHAHGTAVQPGAGGQCL